MNSDKARPLRSGVYRTVLTLLLAISIAISVGNAQVHIDIGTGMTVAVTGTMNLDLSGNWTNAGTFLAGNSTVTLNGLTRQTVTGPAGETFYSLNVNKSLDTVALGSTIIMNGTLTMSNGSFSTGADTLFLASGGSISGEVGGRYVVGNLTMTKFVGTGASSLGGIGVSLDAGGGNNLGNVSVTRVSGPAGAVTIAGKTGIDRKWTITSTNPPFSGRGLTLSWVAGDDNAKDLTTAQVWKSTNNGLTWTSVGTAQDASSTRSLTVNVTTFSEYTVSDASNALPIQLVNFTALSDGPIAELRWSTATESNNYGFEIERRSASVDIQPSSNEWSKMGFVEGSGTSNSQHNYSFVDRSLSPGRYDYRVKQVNNDGTFKYTQILQVEVALAPKVFALSQNYPNPFNPSTEIKFSVARTGNAVVEVYNLIGQRVAVLFDQVAQTGQYYRVTFSGANLPSGLYFARLHSGNSVISKKMTLLK